MSPKFYCQKIFDKNGNLTAVEILTRNYPVNEKTDLYLFTKLLKKIGNGDISFSVPVHVNIFPSTLPLIDWESVSLLLRKKRVVVEIIEDGVFFYRHYISYLIENGISFALDDFGNGSANFLLLKEIPFPIVKVDASIVPPKVAEAVKTEFDIPVLIAEKCSDLSYPADRFQSFKFHEPEEI